MVVHDVGQVVCGEVVGALVEHFVVEDVALDGHSAADEVVDSHVAARLDAEAHHVLGAVGYEALDFLGGQSQGVAHRHACRCVILEVGDFGAARVQLGRSVESYVSLSGIEKHLDVLAVYVAAFALLVWSVGASFADTFVDAYAEPGKGLVDIVFGTGHESLRVGVFDTENHFAPVLAGKEIVIQGSTYAPDVERACGRRCEPHTYFTFICRHSLYAF